MSERVLIAQNNKITEMIDNPESKPGDFSVKSILLSSIQEWINVNCIDKVSIIVEQQSMSTGIFTKFVWDEITHLEFENSEEATLFKMVWF